MSSRPGRPRRHLDATAGREVVFCHWCGHEWYKDEHGDSLVCPSCHSEGTEIVTPENDPRALYDATADEGQPPPVPRRPSRNPHGSDSDPEEADIDDFHPGGFYGRRSVFRGPERFPPPPGGYQPRTNPNNSADIIRSFTELLGDIGGPGGPVNRSGYETHYSASGPRRITYQRISGPNFTGGVSSITITGPGARGNNRQPGALAGGDEEFQRVFGDIFRGPPIDHHDGQGEGIPFQTGAFGAQNRPLDLATALNQLFANLLNPHGTYGDGVYSQEALDRIITNLMEANPQSNAAAPASNEAIDALVRKPLDEEMLGPEGRGECTICIDDMQLGDMATVLPCRHWFHDECVVLWLREHNTCPICRAPIDGAAAGQPQTSASGASAEAGAGTGAAAGSSQGQAQSSSFASSYHPVPPPDWSRPPWASSQAPPPQEGGSYEAAEALSPGSAAQRRRAHLREHGASRLESLRDAGERSRDLEQRQERTSPGGGGGGGNHGGDSGGASGGGGGPLSWLRDQLGRDRRSS